MAGSGNGLVHQDPVTRFVRAATNDASGSNDAGYVGAVNALAAAGADLHSKNRWGETLIGMAHGCPEVVEVLRGHGAS